jgi:hypothetical protein
MAVARPRLRLRRAALPFLKPGFLPIVASLEALQSYA